MDAPSPLEADRGVALVLSLVSAAFLMAGVGSLLRPGRRLVGAGLLALGALAAMALYVFTSFRLPI